LKHIGNIIHINASRPEAESIAAAVAIIRRGGVIVFPTTGLYGLGSNAFNVNAVEALFKLKGRDSRNPILVLIDTHKMLDHLASHVTPVGRYLMKHLWPGRVTFVVSASEQVPQVLTGGTGKIGIRQTAHPVALALVKSLGSPLTGTSANISGNSGCSAINQLDASVKSGVDLILDAGALAGGAGSTVVDVTNDHPIILRHGAVPAGKIMDLFHRFGVNHIDNTG